MLSVFGLRSRQAAALEIDEDDARGEFQDDTEQRPGVGSLRRHGRHAGAVAHGRRLFRHAHRRSASTRRSRTRSQRVERAGRRRFGVADVVFERGLSVQRRRRCARSSTGRSARMSSRPAASAHRLATALSFEIVGDRNPAAANGSSAAGRRRPARLARLVATSSTRAGAWLLDTLAAIPRAVAAGRAAARSQRAQRRAPSCRRGLSLIAGLDARHPAARRRGPLHAEPRLREAGAERLRARPDQRPASAALRSEQAVPGVGGPRARPRRRRVELRLEGYYKRFTDAADRPARIRQPSAWPALARYDFPADLAASIPVDPIITTVPTNDGRGRAYGFDVFVSRHRRAGRCPRCAAGPATPGAGPSARPTGARYPFEYRPPARLRGGRVATA